MLARSQTAMSRTLDLSALQDWFQQNHGVLRRYMQLSRLFTTNYDDLGNTAYVQSGQCRMAKLIWKGHVSWHIPYVMQPALASVQQLGRLDNAGYSHFGPKAGTRFFDARPNDRVRLVIGLRHCHGSQFERDDGVCRTVPDGHVMLIDNLCRYRVSNISNHTRTCLFLDLLDTSINNLNFFEVYQL